MRQPWLLCTMTSLMVGWVCAGLLMWMAWQENAQCEIHCAELGVDWGYWLTLGAAGGCGVHGAGGAAHLES
ncbi:hypothetical protein [Comamonas sp. GB3 AK4-5]|uniref:hypothetical protein n=1 Tax=Comamonas sp. GB3 AK4-5 TaxID=3231487 RepID=UPI00351EE9FA